MKWTGTPPSSECSQGLTARAVRGLARAASRVWPEGLAYVDWLDARKAHSWGGPLNGQSGRQEMLRKLIAATDVAAIVETGTYRGTTTDFLRQVSGVPVYSVESQKRFYSYARRRFAGIEDVHVALGDSRAYVQGLSSDRRFPHGRVLFYLDAHWGPDLPLRAELICILRQWDDPIIVIDDFQVPDDPGYGFDDYGPSLRLCVDYLPREELRGFDVLAPALPSESETGMRRGCAVVVRSARVERLCATVPLRALHIAGAELESAPSAGSTIGSDHADSGNEGPERG
jgi:hypothetical protein